MSAPLRVECGGCKDKEGPFVIIFDPTRPGTIFLCPDCVIAAQGKQKGG